MIGMMNKNAALKTIFDYGNNFYIIINSSEGATNDVTSILKYIIPGETPRTSPCLRRPSGGPRGARLKTSALGDLARKIYFKYQ